MSFIYRIAGNLVALLGTVAIYIGLVGPFLISAPNTFAVVLGLVLAGVLAYWAWKFPALIRRRETLIRQSNSKELSTK